MNKTPLYENHLKLGGKIIDFGGWALPLEYSGMVSEHKNVRNNAGLFDVSHMGEISIKGADAQVFIQMLVTNDISKAKPYQVIYSPMCYPNGGIVDDLIIYKYSNEEYLLIVNASNTDKDFEWIKQNSVGEVDIKNVSAHYAQLALQGPKAQSILQRLTDYPLDDINFFHFIPKVVIGGENVIISRTGYTGEDGFELYLSSDRASYLWDKIIEAGKQDNLLPIGLGARDSLRFEVVLPLYGHEISEHISPLEAGLDKFIKLDKEHFIGKDALVKQKEEGIKRRLVGIELLEGGVPRSHYEVEMQGKNIGFITSGSFDHSQKKGIAIALVDSQFSEAGTEVNIIIRNKHIKAKIVNLPFYSKNYKK